jgi:hypothetical protein
VAFFIGLCMTRLITFVFVLFLSGCAIKADVVKHDDKASSTAKNFTPDDKLAKIYFLTTSKDNFFKIKTGHSADLKVNGNVIGSINDDNVMYFKVSPGTYRFEWVMRSSDLFETRATSVELPYRVASGDVVILRGKYNAGGGAGFGLIGALMVPPKYEIEISSDKDLIKELTVAAPQNCPSTICITTNTAELIPVSSSKNQNQSQTVSQKLSELDDLRKRGLITQKDYDIKKSELLKSM